MQTNLLFLDEPTNHIDEAAKSLQAIHVYPGTVFLVSHEADFMKKLWIE